MARLSWHCTSTAVKSCSDACTRTRAYATTTPRVGHRSVGRSRGCNGRKVPGAQRQGRVGANLRPGPGFFVRCHFLIPKTSIVVYQDRLETHTEEETFLRERQRRSAQGYLLWPTKCAYKNGTVRKRHFCAIHTLNASFYQDRLGTVIGKTQKRVAFFLGLPIHRRELPQRKGERQPPGGAACGIESAFVRGVPFSYVVKR